MKCQSSFVVKVSEIFSKLLFDKEYIHTHKISFSSEKLKKKINKKKKKKKKKKIKKKIKKKRKKKWKKEIKIRKIGRYIFQGYIKPNSWFLYPVYFILACLVCRASTRWFSTDPLFTRIRKTIVEVVANMKSKPLLKHLTRIASSGEFRFFQGRSV